MVTLVTEGTRGPPEAADKRPVLHLRSLVRPHPTGRVLASAVEERRPISGSFLKLLNDTNRKLVPRLRELQQRALASMAESTVQDS